MLNKGNIAESFAGVELIKYSRAAERKQLNYWHREKRGSSAEVDYLLEQGTQIISIEVKSGSTGKMQSLKLFIKEKRSFKAIRISLVNFTQFGILQ